MKPPPHRELPSQNLGTDSSNCHTYYFSSRWKREMQEGEAQKHLHLVHRYHFYPKKIPAGISTLSTPNVCFAIFPRWYFHFAVEVQIFFVNKFWPFIIWGIVPTT